MTVKLKFTKEPRHGYYRVSCRIGVSWYSFSTRYSKDAHDYVESVKRHYHAQDVVIIKDQ